jgi:hypothetical protein
MILGINLEENRKMNCERRVKEAGKIIRDEFFIENNNAENRFSQIFTFPRPLGERGAGAKGNEHRLAQRASR